MLLGAALINTSSCLAELANDAQAPDKTAAPALEQRALLLYLGEFDPELDPVELSQMDDSFARAQEKNTDAKTAAEESEHAANNPKN